MGLNAPKSFESPRLCPHRVLHRATEFCMVTKIGGKVCIGLP